MRRERKRGATLVTMEPCHSHHRCMVTTSSQMNKNCSTWLAAIVIILLQLYSFLSKTWYMLYLDLDGCLSCGNLIMSMGNVFENSLYNVFADDNDIDLYLNHKELSNRAVNDFKSSLVDRQPGELVIETGLYVYVGLWTMTVCLIDGRTCTDVDLSTSSILLRDVQPIGDMLASACDTRPFLLLAIGTHLLLLFSGRLRPTDTTANDMRTTAAIWTVSGLFSVVAVMIAGMPYLTSSGFFQVATPTCPWALLSTVLATYLSLIVAYQTWNSQSTRTVTSFRSWQARQFYKYYV